MIVDIGDSLTLTVKDGRYIVVIVIGVSVGIEQRIFSRARPIHIAVRVHRLLRFRIGDSQQIAARIA